MKSFTALALLLMTGVSTADGSASRARTPGRLAVVQGGDNPRIKLMHPDGSHARTLVPGEFTVQSPAWSPDGRALVFAAGAIYIVRDDGRGLRRLVARGGRDPAFSPDGRFLAYTRGGDLLLARAPDGSLIRRLVTDGLENHSPTWSPDGKRIAFVRERHDFGADLYIVRIATGARHRVTTGSLDGSPAWSPNGRSVAFVRRGLTSDVGGLFLMKPDGSGATALAPRFQDVTDLAWSPDGRELVFVRKIAPDSELFRLQLSSGRVRKVTRNSISDTEPAWGPARR